MSNMKQTSFARNFDSLLQKQGLSRKEAATEIGMSYKVVRRYATAGISRIDCRNETTLRKIVSYFGLPNINSLWQEDMFHLVSCEEKVKAILESSQALSFRVVLDLFYQECGVL